MYPYHYQRLLIAVASTPVPKENHEGGYVTYSLLPLEYVLSKWIALTTTDNNDDDDAHK
jgi:hypothetical protein